VRVVVLCASFVLSVSGLAAAQAPSAPVVLAPRAGAAKVEGACTSGATLHITITTDAIASTLKDVMCSDGAFSSDSSKVTTKMGSAISVTQTVGGRTSAAASVKVTVDGPHGDEREDFESSAYLGLAIDRFAAQEIRNYLNPDANGVQYERSIFGIDFEYRLNRHDTDVDMAPQLWVYGETVHGVRSEDIDCKTAPNVPSCQKTIAGFIGNPPEAALFMLRNASSLEAYAGLRLELKNLNLPGGNPARLYVKGQVGFLEVTGSDGDAKDMHHVAFGATTVGGSRAGSYLEVGFGRTDLFLVNRKRRIKIDGLFQQDVGKGVRLFAELFADVDGKDGADAMQSYFGLSFDVGQIVGEIKK
jgi:hypothetical protein